MHDVAGHTAAVRMLRDLDTDGDGKLSRAEMLEVFGVAEAAQPSQGAG